ncbi:MAG: AAA family ATPase, partial [Candidatus Omnitrophica bacterium]|nr:AAA family ATPase [Candidatus Omnitrophota bacterium]
MYKREITSTLSRRLQEPRRFVQVITGPRQVGKTTAIQQVLAELSIPAHYAAADLPAPPATEWIAQQWELARMRCQAHAPAVLVLDEVQRIPH